VKAITFWFCLSRDQASHGTCKRGGQSQNLQVLGGLKTMEKCILLSSEKTKRSKVKATGNIDFNGHLSLNKV